MYPSYVKYIIETG